MVKKIIKTFYLFSMCLLCTSFSGCDEQQALEYLNKYGVLFNGHTATIKDVKRLIATYSDQLSTEAGNSTKQTVDTQSKSNDGSIPSYFCDSLITTTPRGLSCLHCMEPKARTQANLIAYLLQRSCLKNIAINYLVDGSFSFDAEILFRHIVMLTADGRRPFIYFYLTNGPSQRLYKQTPIKALGTKISPEKFRNFVKYDYETQYKFQLLVRRLIPFIRYATAKGAIVHLIPALEDNLDNESFNKLYELALDALPNDINVAFGRNACEGCFSGNEDGIPSGLFKELHVDHPYFDVRDALITNDGRNYRSNINPLNKGEISLNALKTVRDRAEITNSTFILWDADRQGINTNVTSMFVHPKNRRYVMPPLKERIEIIKFLRGN